MTHRYFTMFECGDVVECISTGYMSVKPGQRRVVRATRDLGGSNYHILLDNNYSPIEGQSWFLAYNFKLVKRRPKVAAKTLHIAVKLSDAGNEEMGFGYIADAINDLKSSSHVSMMAETSGEKIRSRVEGRVRAFPEERWLILSGNILGEIAAPPVRFRSV